MNVPSPGILVAALALLFAALGWVTFFNIPMWAASMLVGAGAITLGVWIGTVVTRDPGLIMKRRIKKDAIIEPSLESEGDESNAESS